MVTGNQNSVQDILSKISGLNEAESLRLLSSLFSGTTVFSTSFSSEDQVITDMLSQHQLPVEIFTLDTGRLFPETYSTWNNTLEKYHNRIIAYYPDAVALQNFVVEKGPNSFYESVENRKACCHIRKVEPLQRAIKRKQLWITGIRAEHSQGRHDMPKIELDAANSILKYHPLLHWTTDDVKKYIQENNVPYNPLHDKGFISIGCAPCTRAIRPGEDFRAGRWWWEDSSKKECGLHIHASTNEEALQQLK